MKKESLCRDLRACFFFGCPLYNHIGVLLGFQKGFAWPVKSNIIILNLLGLWYLSMVRAFIILSLSLPQWQRWFIRAYQSVICCCKYIQDLLIKVAETTAIPPLSQCKKSIHSCRVCKVPSPQFAVFLWLKNSVLYWPLGGSLDRRQSAWPLQCVQNNM